MASFDPFLIDGHKLHFHPERVAQWMAAGDDWEKQKKVYPIYVEISPNGGCNHRCTFCAVDYIGYRPVSLDQEVLKDALSNMALHGVKSVMFAGEGEPLLSKGIGEVINHARSAGLDVAVTTNATPLTERLVIEALGSVSWLKASVNAGTAGTYARVHRTNERDFERVFSNLARAVEIRNQRRWKTTLGAQLVLIPENADEVFLFCESAKRIGLDYAVIKPYSQHLKSASTMERSYRDFRYADWYDLGERLKSLNSGSFKVIFRKDTMRHLEAPRRYYGKCNATPNFWAYLMANGDLYGCSAYLLDDRFKYGNIREQSFSEIWEGSMRRESAKLVRDHLNVEECRKNCRMENVNRYLWDLSNPGDHKNFI